MKNNRKFNTKFSQPFYWLEKLLQELGQEKAKDHSKSMLAQNFNFLTPTLLSLSLFLLLVPSSRYIHFIDLPPLSKKF